jgi:predicted RecA/RadA family phage recombinase
VKNFIQPGNTLTLTAPSGGVVSGSAYLIGSLFVVASGSADAGEPFEGVRVGAFTLPKATGQTWTEGAALYWDDTAKVCTTTATSNTRVGWSASVAATGASTGAVLLSGVA